MTIPTRGVSVRLTSLTPGPTLTTYPELDVASIEAKWAAYEIADGTYASTLETQLANALTYLLGRDKAAVLRGLGGIDAPIGRPGAAQASWLFSQGVGRIRALDNDTASYSREVYVPDLITTASRDLYVDKLIEWAARLANRITAHGGTILGFVVPGMERGMAVGYGDGGDTVYQGAATLGGGGSIGATLTLAGSYGSYPTGSALLKIGLELFHQTSRSGATVNVGRRAHSGSVSGTHAAGAVVRYASAKVTQATFNGYTGPYDHRALNRAAYATLGSEAAIRSALTTYWTDAVLGIAAALDVLAVDVATCVIGGAVLGDGFAVAGDVLDAVAPTLRSRFWAGVANLSDGRAYGTNHPDEHAWLLAALAAGTRTMVATDPRLPSPPVAGALQELVDSGQFAIESYEPRVVETQESRLANTANQAVTASGAYAARTTTEGGYLVGLTGTGGGTGGDLPSVPLFGFWCGSPERTNFVFYRHRYNLDNVPIYYRERGGRGSLDDPLVKATLFPGTHYAVEIDPRYGVNAPHRASYNQYAVTSGATIAADIARLAGEAADLPPDSYCEIDSEFNLVDHTVEGETDAQHQTRFINFVLDVSEEMRSQAPDVKLVCSGTANLWRYQEPNAWLTPAVLNAIDGIASDSYSHGAENKPKTMDYMFGEPLRWATSKGKPFYITEFGIEEHGNDGGVGKAQEYRDLLAWLLANRSTDGGQTGLVNIIFNLSTDGDSADQYGWLPNTTSRAEAAFIDLIDGLLGR